MDWKLIVERAYPDGRRCDRAAEGQRCDPCCAEYGGLRLGTLVHHLALARHPYCCRYCRRQPGGWSLSLNSPSTAGAQARATLLTRASSPAAGPRDHAGGQDREA